MGDSYITIEKLDSVVKNKKLRMKINEEEYKSNLKKIERKVRDRDILVSH